jgi:hypothetical protein
MLTAKTSRLSVVAATVIVGAFLVEDENILASERCGRRLLQLLLEAEIPDWKASGGDVVTRVLGTCRAIPCTEVGAGVHRMRIIDTAEQLDLQLRRGRGRLAAKQANQYQLESEVMHGGPQRVQQHETM